jgi:signal peptidase II
MPLFFLAAVIALLLDQGSKIYIRSRLSEGASSDLIPGWIHLEHVHNYGAAWGVLSGQKWLLIGFTLAVMVLVAMSAREVVARGKMAALGFGLILGGALGNLVDRVAFGYVTDFFDLDTPVEWLRTFPVFNVADSALTVGVVLMLLSLLRPRRTASTAPQSS